MKMPDNKTPLFHSFPLGSQTLEGNLFLGPMAGYTNRSFRQLCVEGGADLTFTEMVSAEGLVRDSKNTFGLLDKADVERHLAVQLFGSNPDTFARAASVLPAGRFCAIDINCGCPVPKVIKTGAGSALLNSPQTIQRIVRFIRNASDLPVTVKIRLGWDTDSQNYLETADAAAQGGAAAVCLHCRTRSQFYAGKPDYSALANLKEHSSIPVIGSGDVFTPEDAARILETTHCDGILFARGAIGQPYIFQQTRDLLTTGSYHTPQMAERVNLFIRQLMLASEDRTEETACKEMRKTVGYFLKGIPNSSKVRQLASTAGTIEDYRFALGQILDHFS